MMHDTIAPEYRITGPAGSHALTRHVAARKAMERRTHRLAVQATGDGVPAQFADWWYDLRRGRLRIYGGLLRFIDTASKTLPKPILLLIPGWIREYIENQYESPAPTRSP